MTQEDKDLLLKDLCSRVYYQIKVLYNGNVKEIQYVEPLYYEVKLLDTGNYTIDISDIKPYLRPMSSMTEEEFEKLKEYSGLKYEQLDLASYQNGIYKCLDFYLSEVPSYVVILVFDWLNKNHFDYRGLIEHGLAIEVTEENNPYKE